MQSTKHEWTPAENQQLLKIKNSASRKEKLQAIATALEIPYSQVYGKWNYLHHQNGTFTRISSSGPNNKTGAVNVTSVSKFQSNGIEPMKFGIVENFNAYNRIDMKEQKSLEMGLDIQINQGIITPENKRAILIPKKLAQRAKKYLAEKYNKHSYCVSTGKNVKEGFAAISRTK